MPALIRFILRLCSSTFIFICWIPCSQWALIWSNLAFSNERIPLIFIILFIPRNYVALTGAFIVNQPPVGLQVGGMWGSSPGHCASVCTAPQLWLFSATRRRCWSARGRRAHGAALPLRSVKEHFLHVGQATESTGRATASITSMLWPGQVTEGTTELGWLLTG